ncbi:UNVERIFIED_CONTAM: hypothetical protein FKN15_000457 [Acipenser sinensis]
MFLFSFGHLKVSVISREHMSWLTMGFKSTDMTSHTGRQLLAVDIPAPARYSPLTVTNGTYTCIIMFATKVALTFKNTLHVDLTNETFVSHTVNSTSSECSDTNTLVSLKYSNPAEGINTLELRIERVK